MGFMQTTDPSLKCHFESCQMMGVHICRWANCCCLSKSTGGCGKRVCAAHRYHPIHGNFQTVVCMECREVCDEDIKKNR